MSRNLYLDMGTLERRKIGGQHFDVEDAQELERILDASSRRVDSYIRRHIFAETKTVVFSPNGCASRLRIPDLLAATSVKLDENGDRTFELTLASATDYYLIRYGAEDEDALPKTMLVLDTVNGQRSSFPSYRRSVQIVGRWGYTETVERLAATGTLVAPTNTALVLNQQGDGVCVGQTLLMGSEQFYVKAGAGIAFTVARGVNGTTAPASPAHAAGTVIDRYVYPPEIVDAAFAIASRYWKRREASYASNVTANPVTGTMEIMRSKLDPDVEALLADFVRGDYLV